jgi:hypothetical protein
MDFERVQHLEYICDGGLVGALRLGKARAVDAVADLVIDRRVPAIDLGAQRLGIEIEIIAGQMIECGVEDVQDIG